MCECIRTTADPTHVYECIRTTARLLIPWSSNCWRSLLSFSRSKLCQTCNCRERKFHNNVTEFMHSNSIENRCIPHNRNFPLPSPDPSHLLPCVACDNRSVQFQLTRSLDQQHPLLYLHHHLIQCLGHRDFLEVSEQKFQSRGQHTDEKLDHSTRWEILAHNFLTVYFSLAPGVCSAIIYYSSLVPREGGGGGRGLGTRLLLQVPQSLARSLPSPVHFQ